jgi:hypothetical protein
MVEQLLLEDSWRAGAGMTCNCLGKSRYLLGFACRPLKLLRIEHGMHSDSCTNKLPLAQEHQEKATVYRHQKRRHKVHASVPHSFRLGLTLVGTSVCDERTFPAITFVRNALHTSLSTNLALCMHMKLQQ